MIPVPVKTTRLENLKIIYSQFLVFFFIRNQNEKYINCFSMSQELHSAARKMTVSAPVMRLRSMTTVRINFRQRCAC